MKILVNHDHAQNEIQNAVIHNNASAPSSPKQGQVYYDTTLKQFGVYCGATAGWLYLSAAGTANVSKTANASAAQVVQVSGGTDKSIADYTPGGSGGILKVSATGVASLALSGTDFAPPTSGSSILKGNGSGGFSNAVSGTDYAPATATTSSLKGNGAGGFAAATLNDNGAPTADFSMNSHKLTNLTDPTSAQDAATKAYVDATAVGIDFKPSVRVATTASGTLTTAFANGQAVDGITLATGDRILIKNQSSAAENGIYVVAASGAPTRATDADTSAELTTGALVFVEQGTVNGGQQWILTTTGTITIGTTAQTWTQFSGASTTTAGAGLTASGNVFAVGAGTGIVVNADNVTVDRSTNGSTVPFKFAQDIGDGTTTAISVTHGLGTQDVIIQVREKSTQNIIECDMQTTSTSAVLLTFATAPALNQYRVVIQG